jgi:hypothetical protein
MRRLLTLLGFMLLVLGILFAAQGSGYLPWPAESFMVGNGRWVFYGGGIGAVGLIVIFMAQLTI